MDRLFIKALEFVKFEVNLQATSRMFQIKFILDPLSKTLQPFVGLEFLIKMSENLQKISLYNPPIYTLSNFYTKQKRVKVRNKIY